MERASRIVNSSKTAKRILSGDDWACAIWPAAVGKVIAAHTLRVRVVRSTLLVEMADATWQKQLFGLSQQILSRVQQVSGSQAISDVEFRVGIPRRQPQRADGSRNTMFSVVDADDEAEQIQDAVLKKVYQLSRKKATA